MKRVFEKYVDSIKKYAFQAHQNVNSKYGDNLDYSYHLTMVANTIKEHQNIFLQVDDYLNTLCASYCHDLIEDARVTYNDLKNKTNQMIADIVFAVTDVPEKNRLLRQLSTFSKTVQNPNAIILKLGDIYANASYSKNSGSSMFFKYKKEYEYKRPLFKNVLFDWYKYKYNLIAIEKFFDDLDKVHDYVKPI